jgi:single-strand DNA-binding protein
MWVTVTCWRALARNVSQSVGVGDQVMVQGRLVYDQWDAADGTRRSAVKVVADAVGFDLSIGIAEFHKIRWSGSGPTGDGENAGAPSEASAQERSPWPAVWVDGDGEDPDLPEAAADHRPRGRAGHVPGDGVGDDPSGVPADPVPQTASV